MYATARALIWRKKALRFCSYTKYLPETLTKLHGETYFWASSHFLSISSEKRTWNRKLNWISWKLTANCRGYLQIFCTGVSKNPSSDILIMSWRRRHAYKNQQTMHSVKGHRSEPIRKRPKERRVSDERKVTQRRTENCIEIVKVTLTSKNCLYLLLSQRVFSSAIAWGWLLQYSE